MNKKTVLRHSICAALAAAIALSAGPTAFADVSNRSDLPDAGRVLRDADRTEPVIPEKSKMKVEVVEPVKPPMPAVEGLKILVREFRVTGQTVSDPRSLESLLAPYTGKEQTFADLNAAADIIAKHLRSQGWFLADAYLPVQDITEGVIEISVVIGRSGDVIVKNQSRLPEWTIRQQLEAVSGGGYIHTDTVERAALLVGDLAGIDTKLTLAPGKTNGVVDIILEVKDRDKQHTGSLALSNHGSHYTGHEQASLVMAWDNLLRRGDALSADVTSAGGGQLTGGFTWRVPVAEGRTVGFGYTRARYEIGEDLAYLNMNGWADTLHADWRQALIRTRDTNLHLTVGYDYRRLQDYSDGNSDTLKTLKTSYSGYITLSGDRVDNYGGGGASSYGVTWRRGHLAGTSDTGALPTGSWDKYSCYFLRQQTVNQRLSLFLNFSGQLAGTNLDSSEKFTLGGANGVRAYPSGEASGDEAWLLTGELRWAIPLKNKTVFQLVGFYDTGVSFKEKNQTLEGANRRALSGYGVGIRWTKPGHWALKVDYARKAGSEAARSDIDRSGRLWVQSSFYF